MADNEQVEGFVEVGTNGEGSVVLNHPTDHVDEHGVGHIIFSPKQAVAFATSLLRHVLIALEESAGENKPKG